MSDRPLQQISLHFLLAEATDSDMSKGGGSVSRRRLTNTSAKQFSSNWPLSTFLGAEVHMLEARRRTTWFVRMFFRASSILAALLLEIASAFDAMTSVKLAFCFFEVLFIAFASSLNLAACCSSFALNNSLSEDSGMPSIALLFGNIVFRT